MSGIVRQAHYDNRHPELAEGAALVLNHINFSTILNR